jgi:hypothetical protein
LWKKGRKLRRVSHNRNYRVSQSIGLDLVAAKDSSSLTDQDMEQERLGSGRVQIALVAATDRAIKAEVLKVAKVKAAAINVKIVVASNQCKLVHHRVSREILIGRAARVTDKPAAQQL